MSSGAVAVSGPEDTSTPSVAIVHGKEVEDEMLAAANDKDVGYSDTDDEDEYVSCLCPFIYLIMLVLILSFISFCPRINVAFICLL